MITKTKFINKYCAECALCADPSLNNEVSFCYDQIFRKNPSKFVTTIFPQLLEVEVMDLCDDQGIEAAVRTIFCSSKICRRKKKKKNRHCKENIVRDCAIKFNEQLLSTPGHYTRQDEYNDYGPTITRVHSKGKKNKLKLRNVKRNKRKKEKRVRKSSFIYGGCAEWIVLVKELAGDEDENINKQQDKVREC